MILSQTKTVTRTTGISTSSKGYYNAGYHSHLHPSLVNFYWTFNSWNGNVVNPTTDDPFDERRVGHSDFCFAKNFDFIIPRKSKIKGVKVTIDITKSGSGSALMRGACVKIFKTLSPDNRVNYTSPDAVADTSWGGNDDLWGFDTITPAQVNSKEFGFAYKVFVNDATVEINSVTIQVFYEDIRKTENDEIKCNQPAKGRKQLFVKVYDSDYNYLNTLTLQDLTEAPVFSVTANYGFGEVILNTAYTYEDFLLGDGTVFSEGLLAQTRKGSKKIKDILSCGNIVDIYISDKEGFNIHIYNGVIDGYKNRVYGDKSEKLSITVVPNTTILGARILRTEESVVLNYYSKDPADIIREIIDRSGTFTYYTSESIPASVGVRRSYTFKCETILNALNKIVELCPDWWIGYVDNKNLFRLKNMYSADLHLISEDVVRDLEVEVSMLRLRNVVYFLGGGSSPMLKKYEKTGSEYVYGEMEHKIVDERVTVEDTAKHLSEKFLDQHKNPEIKFSLTLTDSNFAERGIDIEKFQVGDRLKITSDKYGGSNAEWGNFVWGDRLWGTETTQIYNRVAYITGYSYNFDSITLFCVFNPVQSSQRVEDINRDLQQAKWNNSPNNYS